MQWRRKMKMGAGAVVKKGTFFVEKGISFHLLHSLLSFRQGALRPTAFVHPADRFYFSIFLISINVSMLYVKGVNVICLC